MNAAHVPAMRGERATRSLLGVDFHALPARRAIDIIDAHVRHRVPIKVAFANAHTLNTARVNPRYREVLQRFAVFNDGVGVVIFASLLSVLSNGGEPPTFTEAMTLLLQEAGGGIAAAGWGGFVIATLIVVVMYVTMIESISEMAAAMPHTGGAYSFARSAMGPWGGLVTGLAETIEYVATTGVIVFFSAQYANGITTELLGFDLSANMWIWWIVLYVHCSLLIIMQKHLLPLTLFRLMLMICQMHLQV